VPDDVRAQIAAQLRNVDGLAESPSMFGPDDAFWCNGKEIAHFHAADVVEVRLTKAVIRELRPMLRDDERVALRKGASDWIEVRVAATADVDFVVDLAERAAAAHRAGAGETAKPPPTGSDLERRRRFH
jgi:sugar phosphate isomerase/epimerase